MSSKSTDSGIGFVGVLTIVFVVLKLCGVIHWSWIWVLSPIWISVGATLIFLGCLAFYIIVKHYNE